MLAYRSAVTCLPYALEGSERSHSVQLPDIMSGVVGWVRDSEKQNNNPIAIFKNQNHNPISFLRHCIYVMLGIFVPGPSALSQ